MKMFPGRGRGGPSEDKPQRLEGADRLAAEFDPRLADVWVSVFECWPEGSRIPEELSWFLCMAYLRGYEDALTESRRGALYRNLGVAVPRPGSPGGAVPPAGKRAAP